MTRELILQRLGSAEVKGGLDSEVQRRLTDGVPVGTGLTVVGLDGRGNVLKDKSFAVTYRVTIDSGSGRSVSLEVPASEVEKIDDLIEYHHEAMAYVKREYEALKVARLELDRSR